MRKLARKLGVLLIIAAALPFASVVNWFGADLGLSSNEILCMQLPLITIQITSFVMCIVYHKEIY